MLQVFDTHAHFDDKRFDEDRDALLASLPSRGVQLVVDPGCDMEAAKTAVELAKKYPHVYAAVGIHPEASTQFGPEALALLEKLVQEPKVRAIGEIGLDYYWEDCPPRELQKQVFRAQMDLARQHHLPVIVHDREAHGDTMEIVRENKDVIGVCHCYSGAVEDAKTYVRLGWYLSFTGVITYKNAVKSHEVIRWMPMDRIMIETDSPYLTPVPHRGKRNDSGYVYLVAEKIAQIKGISPEEVAQITMENGKRFFEIE